tara:strand:- start:2246 stop:3229 length:984 start_codon:yes stop_codon:yes gene_type:complete
MFYIVSRGSTATHWLAKNLSKHPSLVCFFSSRSYPPVQPGHGYPFNKNSWVKDNMEASKFLDSLVMSEKATHNSKIFGSIHGYHNLEMKNLVEKKGGIFKYMVRNPIEQVHSAFITYCDRYFISINKNIPNKDIHEFICKNLNKEKTKERHFKNKTSRPHILRNYLSEKNFLLLKRSREYIVNKYRLIFPRKKIYWGYEKDYGNLNENILNLFAGVCRDFMRLQSLYLENWGFEKAIKMEKMFADRNYFKDIVLSFGDNLEVSEDFLDNVFSAKNERVNIHREQPINQEKIFNDLPDCMKEIFFYYFENFNIQELCEKFEYNIKLKN